MDYDEVAIDVAEPRWSVRSVEHMEQIPPRSTQLGCPELERFMKEVVSWDRSVKHFLEGCFLFKGLCFKRNLTGGSIWKKKTEWPSAKDSANLERVVQQKRERHLARRLG